MSHHYVIFFFFFFWLFRYGPIFRTSVAGRPIIVSTDVEFNHYLAKQEGRLVELWYLDSFAELFKQDGENKTNAIGLVHKYVRSITLNHFGIDNLKETLLSQIEEYVNKTLQTWSSLPSVEVKHAASAVSFIFSPIIHLSLIA